MPPAANPDRQRFTLDGSHRLEAHLSFACNEVLAALRRILPKATLEGLLLGGGYGRGEGGVLGTEAGDRPYNDLEFYVCLRGHPRLNEWVYGSAFEALGRMLTPLAGVDVEFKILSLDRLRKSPVSMFSYDLVVGHRWILGNEALLDRCEHHRVAAQIPLHEATRLLMNRCSGLLFARQRLEHTPLAEDDADFIGRNLAKARLGFGDVVLTAHQLYHWSCQERGRRLAALPEPPGMPWLQAVKRHHLEGVEFKLHPVRAAEGRNLLKDRLGELADLGRQVWLWLESRRLNHPFASIGEYASNGLNKCPETKPWRNVLVNVRTSGLSQLLSGRLHRYPRERLLNQLATLLWKSRAARNESGATPARVPARFEANQLDELLTGYQRDWRMFR